MDIKAGAVLFGIGTLQDRFRITPERDPGLDVGAFWRASTSWGFTRLSKTLRGSRSQITQELQLRFHALLSDAVRVVRFEPVLKS
jgi:hypothetical protein